MATQSKIAMIICSLVIQEREQKINASVHKLNVRNVLMQAATDRSRIDHAHESRKRITF